MDSINLGTIYAAAGIASAAFFVGYVQMLVALSQSNIARPASHFMAGFPASLVVTAWFALIVNTAGLLQPGTGAGAIVFAVLVSLSFFAVWWQFKDHL